VVHLSEGNINGGLVHNFVKMGRKDEDERLHAEVAAVKVFNCSLILSGSQ
jgi:hypothetical protein